MITMKQAQSKKKILYFSLGIFILVSGIFAVNALIAGTCHAPTNVLVTLEGKTMTLQEAISGGYLNDGAVSPLDSITTFLSVGHLPSEIWISVDGTENTLDYFLSNSLSLCDPTPQTAIYLQPKPNPGHLASEIQYDATRNLQQAIDQGVFCCVDELLSTTCSGGLCGPQTNNCGNPVDCGACCTPVDASWSTITWSGSCSEICGGGIEYGTRTCGAASCGGDTVCPTDSYGSSTSVSRTCNTQACGVWQPASPPWGSGQLCSECATLGAAAGIGSCAAEPPGPSCSPAGVSYRCWYYPSGETCWTLLCQST